MSKTVVSPGSGQAIVSQSAGLWAQSLARPSVFQRMSGKLPTEKRANVLARGERSVQSTDEMPIVKARDFMAGAMDEVVFDLVRPPKQVPIMGSSMAQGRSVGFDFVDDRLRIDQARFPVNPGSRSSRKRTKYNMKKLARNLSAGALNNFLDQRLTCHAFSGRGTVDNIEWTLPLADSTEYSLSEMMVNPLRAPSRNRHYVCDAAGASLQKVSDAGAGVMDIATADVFSTDLVETLNGLMTQMVSPPRHIKVPGDKMSSDAPCHVLLVPKLAYNYFTTEDSYRQLKADAMTRASRSGNHPIFNLTDAYWHNFLIIPVPWLVAWKAGEAVPYCAATDSQAESSLTVPAAFGTTHVLTRCVILGASALAEAYGTYDDTSNPIFYDEENTDFKDKMEVMTGVLGAASKVQYLMNFGGEDEWTDYGLVTVDIACKIPDITMA